MIASLRTAYNSHFTGEKYKGFLKALNDLHPGAVDFKLSETPVFANTELSQMMMETCESVIDFILEPSFKDLTERSIPPHLKVQHENDHPHFLVFDFGICRNAEGVLEPQL